MTAQNIGSALDRVVHSKTFARSRSLQDFLTFIVTQSLDPDQNLKEYRIGVDALKRGGAFDPAENSIVRVQAYRLRAKLADYYQHEGQTEDVRIELEPGSYTPVIRECAVVSTLRSLRFPGLILDLLPFDPLPSSCGLAPAATFLFTVMCERLDYLLRAGIRHLHASRSSKTHLQVEVRMRAAGPAIRVIISLSDAASRRIERSYALTVNTDQPGLERIIQQAAETAAEIMWQRIYALIGCNG